MKSDVLKVITDHNYRPGDTLYRILNTEVYLLIRRYYGPPLSFRVTSPSNVSSIDDALEIFEEIATRESPIEEKPIRAGVFKTKKYEEYDLHTPPDQIRSDLGDGIDYAKLQFSDKHFVWNNNKIQPFPRFIFESEGGVPLYFSDVLQRFGVELTREKLDLALDQFRREIDPNYNSVPASPDQ